MGEQNALEGLYEALTHDSSVIFRENQHRLVYALVQAAGGKVRLSADALLNSPPNLLIQRDTLTSDVILITEEDHCRNCNKEITKDDIRVKCCPKHTPELLTYVVCEDCAVKLHPKENDGISDH